MYALASQIGNNFAAIELPAARCDDLAPLGRALDRRGANLAFSPDLLSRQTLADLLWAACGADRREPSPARGRAAYTQAQAIDVYVALKQGLYLYDPEQRRLAPVLKGDLRPLAAAEGLPRSGDGAPARLIYVADLDRLDGEHHPDTHVTAALVDCGVVAGNVFNYCAAAGLNAWFHDCDRAALAKRLPLRSGRRVLLAQTIGYPA